MWLKVAAGLSFSMAACQAVISVWPAAAEYFQAPPKLQNDRVRLFVVGEALRSNALHRTAGCPTLPRGRPASARGPFEVDRAARHAGARTRSPDRGQQPPGGAAVVFVSLAEVLRHGALLYPDP